MAASDVKNYWIGSLKTGEVREVKQLSSPNRSYLRATSTDGLHRGKILSNSHENDFTISALPVHGYIGSISAPDEATLKE